MPGMIASVKESWYLFSPSEKRNIALYIVGIMLYKFGLEAFNGSITALATNRYDWEAEQAGTRAKTFQRVGLLQGLNQAFQCVGAILIAPLIKRWPTRLVLSTAIVLFGVLTALLLIIDASTGGKIRPSSVTDDNDYSYYGDYNTDGIIPVYTIAGISYGMVELIRRVIPRDIVGGNVQKLRRMDALVHIFYEVSGTSGAFCTALGLIPNLGNNMAFIITPICFTLAAISWFFVSNLGFHSSLEDMDSPNYLMSIWSGAILFFKSVWTGGKIIFTSRKTIWLLPGYTIALYAHRYLENGIAPAVAKRYLKNSAWSQIMVGGSNFGELFGALFVFLFTNLITTPIPWLRLDALALLIVWYLPYWYPPAGQVRQAWIVAATFLPVSFGWAAGDVSLAAYIQATLARKEDEHKDVSALGAVMAFLYATYIVIYAIANPLLGDYIDDVYSSTGGSNGGNIHEAIQNIAGVQFTIVCVCVLAATFIPKGALAFNPKMLCGESLDHDLGLDEESRGSMEKKDGEVENLDAEKSAAQVEEEMARADSHSPPKM